MAELPWIAKARTYVGQHEIAGARNNPLILKWWSLIRASFTNDETPWCAGFVGGVLESVGIRSSRAAYARSYLTWGEKLSGPVYGAIVVFERGPKNGHVSFVIGMDTRANLMCLGGNQGDAVNVAPFPLHRVLGYRWPSEVAVPKVVGMGTLPTLLSKSQVSTNEA